jgi:hypothetical protein
VGGKGRARSRHRNPQKEVIEVRTLSPTMIRVLAPFAPLFSQRVWQHAQLLLVEMILAPSKRTLASALRAVGLWRRNDSSALVACSAGEYHVF